MRAGGRRTLPIGWTIPSPPSGGLADRAEAATLQCLVLSFRRAQSRAVPMPMPVQNK